MPNTRPETKKQDILLQDDLLLFWRHDDKNWMLHIHRDDSPENPRTDYDNITTMACFHRRHALGDELPEKTPGQFLDRLLREHVDDGRLTAMLQSNKIQNFKQFMVDEDLGWDNPDEILEAFHEAVSSGRELGFAMDALHDDIAFLPMWLYEHSGMTVSCGERGYPYNDKFDSSAIGWCLLEKAKAISELGADESNWREKAENLIKTDVETYDQYLCGDAWYYEIKYRNRPLDQVENDKNVSPDSAWEDGDSCGGFLGSYLEESGMLDAIGYGLPEAVKSGDYETGEASSETIQVWYYKRDKKA